MDARERRLFLCPLRSRLDPDQVHQAPGEVPPISSGGDHDPALPWSDGRGPLPLGLKSARLRALLRLDCLRLSLIRFHQARICYSGFGEARREDGDRARQPVDGHDLSHVHDLAPRQSPRRDDRQQEHRTDG